MDKVDQVGSRIDRGAGRVSSEVAGAGEGRGGVFLEAALQSGWNVSWGKRG